MDNIKVFLKNLKDKITKAWSTFSRKGRILLISSIAAVLIGAAILTVILNQTGYVVLYSGTSAEESAEIVAYIQENEGVSDVRLTADGDILIPAETENKVRTDLSIAGYPKSTFNYDIWDNGVDMFSTDTEKREIQKQQLEQLIMASLNSFDGIKSSYVILNIPETKSYVISDNQEKTTASVVVHLENDVTLSPKTIEGIYNLVQTSVPNLERSGITVCDDSGAVLNSDKTDSDTALDEITLYRERLNFSNDLQDILKNELDGIFNGVYENYNVSVSVDLNYDDQVSEEDTYSPSVDEEGNRGGMVSNEENKTGVGGEAVEGGEVGTTVDADISPDYPTVTIGDDGEFYYESSHVINYLVNHKKTQVEKDGYSVNKISASVVVDSATMTEAERTSWEEVIANAIGTDASLVTLKESAFLLDGTQSQQGTNGGVVITNDKNVLMFLVVALGVILVALLVLALLSAGSKKRRKRTKIVANKAMAAVASADGVSINFDNQNNPYISQQKTEGKAEFDLPSLTDNDGEDSREAVLKHEIRDFAKTNPEIVAQLIRTMMRGDE